MNTNTRRLLLIASMGALAYVLMFFAFPIIPVIPYIKVDFSDVPILLVTFIQGPVGGMLTAGIRSILHYIQTGGDAGYPIGDITSFLATLAYILPIYYVMKPVLKLKGKDAAQKSKKRAILGYIFSTISLTIIMTLLNYFIITPFYAAVMNFPIADMREYILLGIIPFNIIKGILVSIVAQIVLVKVLPLLQKRVR